MEPPVRRWLEQHQYVEAFGELLDLYGDTVLRMATAILKDRGRAEEATQDVFLKVWRALPSYDEGRASVSTWLYAIARNTCLTRARAEAYRQSASLDDIAEPVVSLPEPARAMALRECISLLPQVQQQVLALFYLEGRNIDEVAHLLGMPAGTVKSHLHRARRRLAELLE